MSFQISFTTKKAQGLADCEQEVALLAASTRAGVDITHRCGGHARCGTCVVTVQSGLEHLSEVGNGEKRVLGVLKANPDQRLACQAWAKGDVACSHG